MSKAGFILAVVIVACALALPRPASAQRSGFMGQGAAGALDTIQRAGPDSLNHGAKSDVDTIKEVKRKMADADPRVRADGLEKLRNVATTAEVNELLFRGFNDSDVRVRIKAIDVLGARGSNDAVALMAQSLFLRQTPPVEKLHLVAALGRIGDSRGALPVIEYLKQTDDPASRGTAIFALGEIGDPVANDLLIQAVSNDTSALVRKLAQEAIEKIDGELPNHRQQQLAAEKVKALQPADQKLSKLREMDQQIQNAQY
jgi:HEAT repeat protein